MLVRGSRRRCATFTSTPVVTTSKPPSRHSCHTGESRTSPFRRRVARTARSGRMSSIDHLLPRRAVRRNGRTRLTAMGGWYWIGVAVGVGVGLGLLFSGLLSATRAGILAAVVLGAAAGAGVGFVIDTWTE